MHLAPGLDFQFDKCHCIGLDQTAPSNFGGDDTGFIVSVFEKACSARWRVRVQNPPHSVSLSVPVHNGSLILRRSLRGIHEVMTIQSSFV